MYILIGYIWYENSDILFLDNYLSACINIIDIDLNIYGYDEYKIFKIELGIHYGSINNSLDDFDNKNYIYRKYRGSLNRNYKIEDRRIKK